PTHLAEQKDSIEEKNYNHVQPTVTAPQPQAQPQNAAPASTDEGVFGILGFILAFFIPIIGLIFSIIGINKKKNVGLAEAGIMISVIIILLAIVIAIAVGVRYGFS
ncbi:MAG: DUF4190 domain-containing protein, partial [Clostridiales bacterium]|nr:DUF4190 domain-containing protein [Clostridiales bacterium]